MLAILLLGLIVIDVLVIFIVGVIAGSELRYNLWGCIGNGLAMIVAFNVFFGGILMIVILDIALPAIGKKINAICVAIDKASMQHS